MGPRTFFMEEFYGRFPVTEIQCSHKSMSGRCQNKAIAYYINPEKMIYTEGVEALCGPCCLIMIERSKPEEQLLFQKLKRTQSLIRIVYMPCNEDNYRKVCDG